MHSKLIQGLQCSSHWACCASWYNLGVKEEMKPLHSLQIRRRCSFPSPDLLREALEEHLTLDTETGHSGLVEL